MLKFLKKNKIMIANYHLYTTIKELEKVFSENFKTSISELGKTIKKVKEEGLNSTNRKMLDDLIYYCEHLSKMRHSLTVFTRIGSLEEKREVYSLKELLSEIKNILPSNYVDINTNININIIVNKRQLKTVIYHLILFLKSKNNKGKIKIRLKNNSLNIIDSSALLSIYEIKNLFKYPDINNRNEFNGHRLYGPILKKTLDIHNIPLDIKKINDIGNIFALDLTKVKV